MTLNQAFDIAILIRKYNLFHDLSEYIANKNRTRATTAKLITTITYNSTTTKEVDLHDHPELRQLISDYFDKLAKQYEQRINEIQHIES